MTGSSYLLAAALGAVLALVLLMRRAAALLPRGFARIAPGCGALVVEQVLAIDMRRRVLLLRCGERRLLLLTGGAADVPLGWVDPPDTD